MPKKYQGISSEYIAFRSTIAREISIRIHQKRLDEKFTQETLRARLEIERVHLSRSQYSRIENGEVVPDAVVIIALAKIFNVSVEWILLGNN